MFAVETGSPSGAVRCPSLTLCGEVQTGGVLLLSERPLIYTESSSLELSPGHRWVPLLTQTLSLSQLCEKMCCLIFL